MTRPNRQLPIAHCALGIALVALAAKAITQAEWEADNSLIPTASASSPLYVAGTEPSATFAGEADYDSPCVAGIDSTFTIREYDFSFETKLSTRPGAMIIFVR